MIRNSLILFLSLFLFTSLFAQDPPPKKIYNKQFGFDASVIFDRFINFSGTTLTSPYQITYRTYGETSNKRYGLGFQINVDGGDVDTRSQTSILFRFGKERFKNFGKSLPRKAEITRWRAFYGLDWKSELGFFTAGSGSSNTFSLEFGPSPFFGIAFYLNEQLSVSTEMAYSFTLTYSRNGDFDLFQFRNEFVPPVALYLNYDF